MSTFTMASLYIYIIDLVSWEKYLILIFLFYSVFKTGNSQWHIKFAFIVLLMWAFSVETSSSEFTVLIKDI